MKTYTAKIDANAYYSDLIKMWNAGDKSKVIAALASDHPGLTAVMIVQGAQDKSLTVSDCNEIANRLIDVRVAMARR